MADCSNASFCASGPNVDVDFDVIAQKFHTEPANRVDEVDRPPTQESIRELVLSVFPELSRSGDGQDEIPSQR